MVRQLAITILLLAGGTALAAEDAAQRAQRCASVPDSLERLVCYDEVFRGPSPTSGATQRAASPPAVMPRAATPPSSAPPAAAPGAVAPPTADFGAEQLRRSTRDDTAEEARTMTGTVAQLRETRRNVFRITLENGQIWQQMDMDSLFHVQIGDAVEINRGRLGGYRMARTSRGGSGWVRVNRVK